MAQEYLKELRCQLPAPEPITLETTALSTAAGERGR